MIGDWLRAFALTQLLELPLHAQAPGLDLRLRQRLAVGFGASAITHPLVWFVIPALVQMLLHPEPAPAPGTLSAWVFDAVSFARGTWRSEWWVTVAVAETFAVLAEALWLMAFSVRAPVALAWSLMANAWSFSIGLFCYQRLGW